LKIQLSRSNGNRGVHPIVRLLDPGDSFHMVATVRDVNEPPILWSIPFTLLLITVILAAADYLLPFIPLQVGREKWMWFASTMGWEREVDVVRIDDGDGHRGKPHRRDYL
jgi:hypothetical protein